MVFWLEASACILVHLQYWHSTTWSIVIKLSNNHQLAIQFVPLTKLAKQVIWLVSLTRPFWSDDLLLEKANEGNSRALLNAEPSNIGARLIVEQCFSCYCYLQLQKVVLELKVILSTLLLVHLTAMPKEVWGLSVGVQQHVESSLM